jgi:hypothetical protein
MREYGGKLASISFGAMRDAGWLSGWAIVPKLTSQSFAEGGNDWEGGRQPVF